MSTRLITTDTRIKYLLVQSIAVQYPLSPRFPLGSALRWIIPSENPAWSMAIRRLAGPPNRLVLHHNPSRFTELRHHHPGSSSIHPTSLFISCHSQTYFANFPRRVCWHCLRRDHPISRCYQLARTHTDLPRGRESCTGVRCHRRRASEFYQVDF